MKHLSYIVLGAALVSAPAHAGAPAKMKRAPESLLNQLQLTPKAVQRLGIVAGPVEEKVVPRTLTVGGSPSVYSAWNSRIWTLSA